MSLQESRAVPRSYLMILIFFWFFLCSEIGAFSFYFEVTANMKVLFS